MQWGLQLSSYFYSRPCGRGDQHRTRTLCTTAYFYSRPCGRGDLVSCKMRRDLAISTHAPAGGATPHRRIRTSPRSFLLTPLREGRPSSSVSARAKRNISTHAPAGGATRDSGQIQGRFRRISTHAPAGGATLPTQSRSAASSDFYSRPCGRGDPQLDAAGEIGIISTHAPAGGATIVQIDRVYE